MGFLRGVRVGSGTNVTAKCSRLIVSYTAVGISYGGWKMDYEDVDVF